MGWDRASQQTTQPPTKGPTTDLVPKKTEARLGPSQTWWSEHSRDDLEVRHMAGTNNREVAKVDLSIPH